MPVNRQFDKIPRLERRQNAVHGGDGLVKCGGDRTQGHAVPRGQKLDHLQRTVEERQQRLREILQEHDVVLGRLRQLLEGAASRDVSLPARQLLVDRLGPLGDEACSARR